MNREPCNQKDLQQQQQPLRCHSQLSSNCFDAHCKCVRHSALVPSPPINERARTESRGGKKKMLKMRREKEESRRRLYI